MRLTSLLVLTALVSCTEAPVDVEDTDTDGETDGSETDTDTVDDTDDTDEAAPDKCVTTSESDANADGIIDARSVTTSWPTRTVTVSDEGADGNPERRIERTYDPTHTYELLLEFYALPANVVTRRNTTTLDAKGRVTRIESDNDADGIINEATAYTHHNNDAVATRTYMVDQADAGAFDFVSVFTFNEDNLPVSYTRDEGNNGTFENSETWTYDGKSYVHAWFDDGTRQRSENTIVDAQDRTTRLEQDNDGDLAITSDIDFVTTYTFTASGQPDVDDDDGYDGAPDGTPEFSTRRSYDDDDHLLSYWRVRLSDDAIVDRGTYTYDARGNGITQEDDLDGDGVITNGWRRTYDGRDRITEYVEIIDGNVQRREVTAYVGDTELILSGDDDGDGQFEQIVHFFYDADGRTVKVETDADANGVVDSITTSTFTCAAGVIPK